MSAFILKLIACFSMFIDHIGYVAFGKYSWFNYIGRLAFPIFAFQISEGYTHTKDLKKYFLRLLVFAIISQIPFYLFCNSINISSTYNVIFTLLLGLLSITIYDKYHKFVGITVCLFLGVLAQFLHFDYGVYGVFIVLLFYIFKNNKKLSSILFVLSTFIYYLISVMKNISAANIYTLSFIFTCLSLIFILNYNGKKGRNAKYLFYIFYPSHLLLLYILNIL